MINLMILNLDIQLEVMMIMIIELKILKYIFQVKKIQKIDL